MLRRIPKKPILIAAALFLVGVLGAGGAVGYLTFLRSPANPPSQACGAGRPTGSGPVVVAAGASMTQGTLGADWVGALRERPEFAGYTFVNAGVNGNTVADLLGRVDTDVVRCRPDAVVVLVGTNDVRGEVSVDRYRADLGALVDRIESQTSARVALLSLPPLGEDLEASINHRLGDFNAAIESIAATAGIDYLPVHEQFADRLRRSGGPATPFDFGFPLAFRAAAKHYLLGRSWDEVARSHHLELLVDHIHLSDQGGAVVTDLVGRWLGEALRRKSRSR
ncbi:SGNH/GDSL hydrolase family protein [Nocardia salmonicida]|uniref:SGNH/GDSL hydrolase family protein n=1 Tax=Nocardia salmonicida TaxID=53431 RepID=UPI002E2AA84B|nr:GDSL-type esterase/lipase family protein [Nocardia salmonicida]